MKTGMNLACQFRMRVFQAKGKLVAEGRGEFGNAAISRRPNDDA
jgi:hypothetical protein